MPLAQAFSPRRSQFWVLGLYIPQRGWLPLFALAWSLGPVRLTLCVPFPARASLQPGGGSLRFPEEPEPQRLAPGRGPPVPAGSPRGRARWLRRGGAAPRPAPRGRSQRRPPAGALGAEAGSRAGTPRGPAGAGGAGERGGHGQLGAVVGRGRRTPRDLRDCAAAAGRGGPRSGGGVGVPKPPGGEQLGTSGRGGGGGRAGFPARPGRRQAPFAWRWEGRGEAGDRAAGESAELGRGFGPWRSREELPPLPLRRRTGAHVPAAALPGSLLFGGGGE